MHGVSPKGRRPLARRAPPRPPRATRPQRLGVPRISRRRASASNRRRAGAWRGRRARGASGYPSCRAGAGGRGARRRGVGQGAKRKVRAPSAKCARAFPPCVRQVRLCAGTLLRLRAASLPHPTHRTALSGPCRGPLSFHHVHYSHCDTFHLSFHFYTMIVCDGKSTSETDRRTMPDALHSLLYNSLHLSLCRRRSRNGASRPRAA